MSTAKKSTGRNKRHPPGVDTHGYSMQKVLGRTAEVLTEPAKQRRQLFAAAYVANGFNGKKAAMQIGIPPASAAKQASEMIREPYTSELIENLKAELLADTTRLANIIRLRMFREAHFEGMGASHGARVSALTTMGKWYNIEPREARGAGGGVGKQGPASGVMEIPLCDNLTEWTQAAALSQAKLMEDVRK